MTDEELESMEIDWTQGVAENFERVKSAALAALDAANRRADEAERALGVAIAQRNAICDLIESGGTIDDVYTIAVRVPEAIDTALKKEQTNDAG